MRNKVTLPRNLTFDLTQLQLLVYCTEIYDRQVEAAIYEFEEADKKDIRFKTLASTEKIADTIIRTERAE